jgi:hypothetical protein
MKLDEVDLDTNPVEHVPSPRRCIYCPETEGLTHEHVIPFGLGAHTLILNKASCQACQRTIQPYEQAVLKHQLGNFRAQIGAPTRRPKDRPTAVRIPAIEVDHAGRLLRDLGTWTVPIGDAPLLLNLWSSPPPRLLLSAGAQPGIGRAWSFAEASRVGPLAGRISAATGARHVALKAGEVNRLHYLRFLAKTGHAFAAARIGLDAFDPVLPDFILNRSDNLSLYVGDDQALAPIELHPAATSHFALGEITDGPAKGYVGVGIRLYPSLNTPFHVVIVGKATADIGAILGHDNE